MQDDSLTNNITTQYLKIFFIINVTNKRNLSKKFKYFYRHHIFLKEICIFYYSFQSKIFLGYLET